MFGEKAEEYDDLRMDLEHVKSMYKQQIEELIQKESFRRWPKNYSRIASGQIDLALDIFLSSIIA